MMGVVVKMHDVNFAGVPSDAVRRRPKPPQSRLVDCPRPEQIPFPAGADTAETVQVVANGRDVNSAGLPSDAVRRRPKPAGPPPRGLIRANESRLTSLGDASTKASLTPPTPIRELVCPRCFGCCVSRHPGFCCCTTCRWTGPVTETEEYRHAQ